MAKALSATQDYYNLRFLSMADHHEGAGLLAYTVSQGQRGEMDYTRQVVLRHTATGVEEIITAGGKSEQNPLIRPDGGAVAFVSDASGQNQLWVCDLHTGQATQLTHMRHGVRSPIWSPKGDRIAFLSPCATGADVSLLQTPLSSEEQARDAKRRAQSPVVIEDYGYKNEDAMGFAQKETTHLWVVDAAGGAAIQLTDGDRDHVMPCWAPDGDSLIFVSNRNRPRQESIGMDLFRVSAAGDIVQLSQDVWIAWYPVAVQPCFTPDGQSIIFGALSPTMAKGMPPTHLYKMPAMGGEAVPLFPEALPCHEASCFIYNCQGLGGFYTTIQPSSCGKYVYFIAGWHGAGNIYRASLEGEPEVVPFIEGQFCFRGLCRPQNGKLVAARGDFEHSIELFEIDEATGVITQITDSNPWLSKKALAPAHALWIDTLDGESRVQGWVIEPQNRQPGGRYPAVLYIHGGPTPFYGYGLTYEYQCLAAAGMAVILCNPRGSGGYGAAHQSMARAFDGGAYHDLLQFTQAAVDAFDWIDGDRLGVCGGSYGGYMTNWMAGHSKRFKAAVSQRSVASFMISYASSDMAGSSKGFESFRDFMEHELKRSPVAYADKIDIPFLILQSTGDMRTPVEGAHQLYTAVKDTHPDLPVRMVLFPKSNHNLVNSGPMPLRVAHYDETIDWLKKFL